MWRKTHPGQPQQHEAEQLLKLSGLPSAWVSDTRGTKSLKELKAELLLEGAAASARLPYLRQHQRLCSSLVESLQNRSWKGPNPPLASQPGLG